MATRERRGRRGRCQKTCYQRCWDCGRALSAGVGEGRAVSRPRPPGLLVRGRRARDARFRPCVERGGAMRRAGQGGALCRGGPFLPALTVRAHLFPPTLEAPVPLRPSAATQARREATAGGRRGPVRCPHCQLLGPNSARRQLTGSSGTARAGPGSLHGHQDADIEDFKAKKKELEEIVQPIISKLWKCRPSPNW